MAKKIYISDEQIEEFVRKSHEQLIAESQKLKTTKFQHQTEDIKVNFPMTIPTDDRRASIVFSEKAWTKLYALVHTYTTEIEWHGLVERTADNAFYIKDVLIFPHKVTGVTVESDQVEYEKWLDSLDNETFNALRFHGHSHVNMGVTPSNTDMEYRCKILNVFGTPSAKTDYFYIFLIFNKRGEISGEIYDLQQNALYSTKEIDISVEEGGDWFTQFLNEVKKVVKEHTYSYSAPNYPGNYGGSERYDNPFYCTVPTNNSQPRHSAKSTARQQGSVLDDDAPDPMDDEYYSVPGCKPFGGIK